MSLSGIIVLCHGSRGERAVTELPEKMNRIVRGTAALLPGNIEVAWAALQFNHPTLEETAASLVDRGVSSVLVVPYFLFSGRHIDEDIPEIMELLPGRYPKVNFTMAEAIGDGHQFISQVVNRVRENKPELWLGSLASPVTPGDIERQSLGIIEKLLPLESTLSGGESAVVKRLIHAGGDPQLAGSVCFSPAAVDAGIEAVRKGCPIFTDVRMVAAGINAGLAGDRGCPVTCALDEAGDENVSEGNVTRTAAAIRQLGGRLDGAVIAIGNAPTALLALLDLIDGGKVKPALVIGMPVGFVQAAESKEALMKRSVPFITVAGTRGGSALAAAAVNALLKLAAGE